MADEKKDSKSKVIIIVLIIVIVLMIGGGVTAFLLLSNGSNTGNGEPAITTQAQETAETTKNPLKLDYDDAAVALDEDSLQKQFEELQKNAEGNISLEYKNYAISKDGKEFECYLANSELNTEDMFIAIFTDASMEEQVYLSGLLRPGTVIENFTSEINVEKGEHSFVVMFTSVSDDHETMTSQIAVELKVTVE